MIQIVTQIMFKISFFFLFFNSFIILSSCQSPQNIETFYPFLLPPPPLPPPPSPPPVLPPPTPLTTPPPPPADPPSSRQSTSRKAIFTAVGVTAASSLIIAGAVFFFFTRYTGTRRRNQARGGAVAAVGGGGGGNNGRLQPVAQSEFARFDGNIKGLIVDEDGLDVLYWKKLEGSQKRNSFKKEIFSRPSNNQSKRLFSREKSSTSYNNQTHNDNQSTRLLSDVGHNNSESPPRPAAAPPRPPPPPPPLVKPPPPPPPVPQKKGPTPPPPPPSNGGAAAVLKPPPAPKRTSSGNVTGEDGSDQVKLKPLHWEKVNIVNKDHSMVWDKIERGSFQYNGDMMEALFGYVASNHRSPKDAHNVESSSSPPPKIFILDQRRSQNIAIVLKSLGISKDELISGLQEGKGLNLDTLEKLARIAPTQEEKSQILAFDGDPSRLADAESFLCHLLNAVPTAFTRVDAMLFRLNYDSEVKNLEGSLKTIELACNELRNRGVFLKLLEAILKAGNRLNAGTSRGDAKAFNLSTLLKLSDYKSSDGKTTLLHFVVHEVVRNEGKRCVLNRNNSLRRHNGASNPTVTPDNESMSKDEKEREFLKLGLPIVGGLSAEFSNVKKAATIDSDAMSSTAKSLATRVAKTQKLVVEWAAIEEESGFVWEIKGFVEGAEKELKELEDEQERTMSYVKRTMQYYQSGGFKEKQPLQLFGIVRDFLGMVDQACIDIARGLQQQRKQGSNGGAGSSTAAEAQPEVLRTRVTFPRLPDNFLSNRSGNGGSDDEG